MVETVKQESDCAAALERARATVIFMLGGLTLVAKVVDWKINEKKLLQRRKEADERAVGLRMPA